MLFQMLAVMNENALRGMTTKSTSVARKRRERGDHMGRAPYGYRHVMKDGVSNLVPREDEDLAAVVAAFQATGTYNSAAKLLNDPKGEPVPADDGSVIGIGIGLPTRLKHKITGASKTWDASTVHHIVLREAPHLVPPVKHRGSPAATTIRRFGRLLRCPHADLHPESPFLTSAAAPGKEGPHQRVRYYCRVARSDATHARPYIVAESKVLPWAKAELLKLGGRMERVEKAGEAESPDAKVEALGAQREGIGDAYAAGAYGPVGSPAAKAAMAQPLAAIEAQMPALEMGRRAMAWWADGTLRFAVHD
jgi:hypothetical protein